MKNNLLTTILLLTITLTVKGQIISNTINDKEIADFFSWRTNQNSGNKEHKKINRINLTKLKFTLTDITESDLLVLNSHKKKIIDSVLTNEDKLFIHSQIDTSKTNWTNNVLKKITLIVPKDIMKLGKNDDYYEFSQPVFTKDYKICFLNQAYHCGFMCSDWSTLMFEKTNNGEWRLIMTISAISS